MPYKMNAQSFARCETNKAFINVQRMHDGGRTKSLHDAATQMTAIRHPATLPLPQTGIALLFLVLGGEPALCGSCKDAPTPTTANARMRDSGRTKSAQGRADPNDRILTNPATLPLPQTGIALLFLVLGGEPATCG